MENLDASYIQRNAPVAAVHQMEGVVMASAGNEHSLALKTDGIPYAFGYNDKGQLGDGGTSISTIAIPMLGLNNIISIVAGKSAIV